MPSRPSLLGGEARWPGVGCAAPSAGCRPPARACVWSRPSEASLIILIFLLSFLISLSPPHSSLPRSPRQPRQTRRASWLRRARKSSGKRCVSPGPPGVVTAASGRRAAEGQRHGAAAWADSGHPSTEMPAVAPGLTPRDGEQGGGPALIRLSPPADVPVHRAVPEPLPQARLQGRPDNHDGGLQAPGTQGNAARGLPPALPVPEGRLGRGREGKTGLFVQGGALRKAPGRAAREALVRAVPPAAP